MPTDPVAHYRRNESTYNRIADELERVNELFVSANRNEQKTMLFDSTVFAVISVQNDVSVLRKSFRRYARADDPQEIRTALRRVNYGNNKYQYIRKNETTIKSNVGDTICRQLENGDTWEAVGIIVDNLSGLSWVKSAFVPAMLGFTEVMCIDTNVEQMVPDDSVVSKGYDSFEEYRSAVSRVESEFLELSNDLSPFMTQWVLFDANRGQGVEKHREWFEEQLPGTSFGRQTFIGDY